MCTILRIGSFPGKHLANLTKLNKKIRGPRSCDIFLAAIHTVVCGTIMATIRHMATEKLTLTEKLDIINVYLFIQNSLG